MARVLAPNSENQATAAARTAGGAVFPILVSISFCHLLNDLIQSLLPAIYPILKTSYHLDFGQVGMITLCNQLTASILQPVVGHAMDKRPAPYSLSVGMGCMFFGLFLLAYAPLYGMILLAASLTGIGSAIFHPESSRVARMASGGQHGLAQSIFQLGGNFGSSLGPLLAAFIVLPNGQHSVAWFTVVAVTGVIITYRVGGWYKERVAGRARGQSHHDVIEHGLSKGRVRLSIAVLLALMFSKFFYLASLTSYYTFYLIDKFHVSVRNSQYCLFVFLASVAAGTIIGGPVGDRMGRKLVIWCSILGVLPFSLALPHASLAWTIVLSIPIGIILASAFPAIIVYAQELLPGRIGLISGLFFGVAFGLGGIGAAVLGELADKTSIRFVYQVCAFLPAIGLLTALLPNIEKPKPVRI
ncbi:MAG TPA: MFS transporter [Bryobacteraceae bacterium]|nr:MFS transporter [Bryobacteraceae bacterium]